MICYEHLVFMLKVLMGYAGTYEIFRFFKKCHEAIYTKTVSVNSFMEIGNKDFLFLIGRHLI